MCIFMEEKFFFFFEKSRRRREEVKIQLGLGPSPCKPTKTPGPTGSRLTAIVRPLPPHGPTCHRNRPLQPNTPLLILPCHRISASPPTSASLSHLQRPEQVRPTPPQVQLTHARAHRPTSALLSPSGTLLLDRLRPERPPPAPSPAGSARSDPGVHATDGRTRIAHADRFPCRIL